MVGAAQADVGGLAIGRERDAHRRDVVGAHALDLELQRVDHAQVGGRDDADAGAQLVGDPQLLAVGGQHHAARALADGDVLEHLAGLGVDDVDHVRDFRGHVDTLAIGRGQHTFGFLADRNRFERLACGDIDHRERTFVFGGEVGGLAVKREVEDLGVVAEGNARDRLAAGDVDDVGLARIAARHHQARVALDQLHVARAFAGLDDAADRERFRIDHGQRVVLLAADENLAAVLGEGRGGKAQADGGHPESEHVSCLLCCLLR